VKSLSRDFDQMPFPWCDRDPRTSDFGEHPNWKTATKTLKWCAEIRQPTGAGPHRGTDRLFMLGH
jgi:hypothetical protein